MSNTYIFIGRSGCGKGTQAKLLATHLEDTTKAGTLYIETGARFREFVALDSETSLRAREIMTSSRRQPDFLAVWMWSHLLVEGAESNKTWIIDGTPRSLIEAQILDTAFPFYSRTKPVVVYLDVSERWSRDRMLERKRSDDLRPHDIEERLAWFQSDVLPAIHWYEQNPNYQFVRVNGEQSIEAIHADILRSIEPEA